MFSSVLVALALASGLPQSLPGAVKVAFDQPIKIGISSAPVKHHGSDLSIVSLGECTFHREDMRVDFIGLAQPNAVPPGIYGFRWNYMPPKEALEPVANLKVSPGPFLRATVKASVAQYTKVEYRISCSVFDANWKLLGTASLTEQVDYIRLGHMPVLFRELQFDFGASQDYSKVAHAVFSVSNPVVPKPADGS